MSTSKLARRAWGLDTGPDDRHWSERGLCRRAPDMWSNSGRCAFEILGRARHICLQHCPVLADCLAEAVQRPVSDFSGTITAGRYHAASKGRGAKISTHPPVDPGHGHWCRGLEVTDRG